MYNFYLILKFYGNGEKLAKSYLKNSQFRSVYLSKQGYQYFTKRMKGILTNVQLLTVFLCLTKQ